MLSTSSSLSPPCPQPNSLPASSTLQCSFPYHWKMVECQRSGAGSHRQWPSFSAAFFRRLLLNSMRCGASRRQGGMSPEKQRPLPPRKLGASARCLSELLKFASDDESEGTNSSSFSTGSSGEWEARRKMEAFEELCKVVKLLQLEEEKEKRKQAASEVRRLAKDDADARETLAMLGAIPTLVGMLDMDSLLMEVDFQIHVLYALLNLGIGNDMNKAAIVKAGAVHKMLKMMELTSSGGDKPPAAISEAVAANFLGLSALDANKPVIGSSGAIPVLAGILRESDAPQAKQDALRAVFNLSITPSNIPIIVDADLVRFLVASIGNMEVSERALAVLTNVVAMPEGRRAVAGAHPEALAILVDVLGWSDSPACQEKASYVLMVLAHRAWWDRSVMVDAGVVSAALELALVGSTLAQKRASRILECLTADKGKQACGGQQGPAVSAPLMASPAAKEAEEVLMEMSEERRAVRELVQQSLQSNMRRIVKRANLPEDLSPSGHFKSLTAIATSKSLPL